MKKHAALMFCCCLQFAAAAPAFGILLPESVKQMSLEEKVGQLLMAGFRGEEANEEAKTLVQEVHVGGIIYYTWANSLSSFRQVQALSSSLQQLSKETEAAIPLFIAADQEGGLVARLQQGFTIFPGSRAIAEAGDPELAEAAAFAMGQELRAAGINMNLAPVVDVNTNPKNPIIGIRSFGSDPSIAVLFGKKALDGYSRAKILPVLKHFPGHGDVALDSHHDLPVVLKPLEELQKVELFPFAQLSPSADAVMTAHLLVPALDADACSTLSEKTVSYLRNEIGFQGLIITDSLVMEGVLKECHTVDEAAIQALLAGCDVLLLGGRQLVDGQPNIELSVHDIRRIHRGIVEAVQSGRISEARVNQAVEKILKVKRRYGMPLQCEPRLSAAEWVHPQEHKSLAQKIASLALKTVQGESNSISSICQKRIAIIAPQLLRAALYQTTLPQIGKGREISFYNGLNPSRAEIEAAKAVAAAADIVLVCSYNAWKNPAQAELIQTVSAMEKPLAVLVVRDPCDAELFGSADLIFTTFSPDSTSIQAAVDRLCQK